MATRSTLAACFVLFLGSLLAVCASPPPGESSGGVPTARGQGGVQPFEPRVDDAGELPAYVREVLSDEPVAYWRLEGDGDRRVDWAIEGDSDGATRFDDEHSIVLGGMNEFDKYAFTVSMWVKAPNGRFLAYTSEEQPAGLVLEYGDSLAVTIAGQRVDTGVEIADRWQLLSLSWRGEGGHAVVAVDDRKAWSGRLAANAVLESGAKLIVGGAATTLDEIVWYDRKLHHSSMRTRQAVARGEAYRGSPIAPPSIRTGLTRGHSGKVTAVAYSPDARTIASASDDQTIKLWHLESGHELRTLDGHAGAVTAVVFSPDGQTLASSSHDGSVRLWDVSSGTELEQLGDERLGASSVAFNRDGDVLAAGYKNGEVKLWDAGTAELLRTIEADELSVSSVDISPDGAMLATGGSDAVVKLWDIASGRRLRAIETGAVSNASVSFTPDGKALAADVKGSVKLWAVESGEELRTLSSPTCAKYGVEWLTLSRDGQKLAASCVSSVQTWEVASGRPLQNLEGYMRDGEYEYPDTSAGVFGPRGETLALGADSGRLRLWNVQGAQIERELAGGAYDAKSVAFRGDGKTLATGGGDGVVRLWDLSTGSELRRLGEPDPWESIMSIAFSADGSLLASATGSGQVVVWDVDKSRMLHKLDTHDGAVMSIAFGPDGQTLVSGGQDGQVKIWAADTGKVLHALSGHAGWIMSVAFSSDGKTVASAGRDGTIRLWDAQSGTLLHNLTDHIGTVASVAFGPDGKVLASLSQGSSAPVRLWDVASGECLGAHWLGGDDGWVSSLTFSPGGKHLVLGGSVVKYWDIEAEQMTRTLSGHGSVKSMLFSRDGGRFALGATDGTVRMLDLESNAHLNLLSTAEEWLVYTDDGYFDASPNGAGLVHAVQGLRTFGIDQLALKNNRPDIILKRMGMGTPELIAHYEEEWRRRVAKAGLTEKDLAAEADLPDARILRARKLDDEPGLAEVIFEFRDTRGLKNYQIYVDNVPLFEGYGKPVDGEKKRVQIRHEVPLTDGANKIEVSALSTRGQESLRASRVLEYADPKKGDLYFVGFGVSDYADDSMDLKYAATDVADMKSVLENAGEQYDEVHMRPVVDEKVTRESIRETRKWLAQTEPRDTVVLFVAGHGMYDRSEPPTYYYLTHDADLDDLENTAVNFDEIEALLDGIPARNKLFLMDTCQSGESPKRASLAPTGKGARGMKARALPRGFITASTAEPAEPRPWLLERDRFIYRDLRRRTGAIVVSSSRGSEYSYESPEWKNGAFTEAVVEALTGDAADRDDDGAVSTDELREYVREKVPELTDGAQNPTVDRDNIHRKFALPLIGARGNLKSD
ncbi:MAG: caspase family protein [Myxococcota bacterium]